MDARRRLATPVVIAVTALILVSELFCLLWVFHLDDGVDARELAHARASTAVTGWSDAGDPAVVTDAVGALVATDAPGSASVDRAATAWAADPTPSNLELLRGALEATGEGVTRQQATTEVQVVAILATLLVVVSVGWFVWFRRLVARHRDLQRRLTSQQVLDSERHRLTALVANSEDVIAILDSGSTVRFVSPAAAPVLGLGPEDLVGVRLVDRLEEGDRLVLAQALAASRPGRQPLVLRFPRQDGYQVVLEGTLVDQTTDPAVEGFVLTLRDVTERRKLTEQLEHQSFHDALTGLANRQLFADRLSHALVRRDHGGVRTLTVLFIDLDDFKNVNDSLGHGVGDDLLAAVAERLSATTATGDTIARLGGDEFAVLLEDTDLTSATSTAETVSATLAAPFELHGHHLALSCSIGIAQALPGRTDGEELMRNADVALYMAKERGKGSVAVYDSSWHHRTLEVLEMRNDLQWAIESDELVLHYQPTVDLRTQSITGFEALVRWEHPERGLIPPGAFVPVAEQSGLILPLGRWVLHRACEAAVRFHAGGHRPTMAVNVSVQQMSRPDFVDDVVSALAQSRLPASSLVLEITESTLLSDTATTIGALTLLRQLGVRVAIDDFGTGYSSLSQLATLPVDVLKVDKSFVDGIDETETGSTSLIRAILAMGDTMGLTTVAEGVEHQAQALWLQQTSCTLGQGYLWSRPVPVDEAEQLLRHGIDVGLPRKGPRTGVPDLRIV
ncbi:putative bifunctional diguanylate cyclase/phosphodiesterase [Solicola sp. PLA-1-18]|uniref:putative bifunctional diguanylate cyclase/phosphodiesterase n=1 Tax=Solicola sp. PLA-1-18 TaxID=3380532 RepID=UPI003B7DB26C